jgi:hypothetical protein
MEDGALQKRFSNNSIKNHSDFENDKSEIYLLIKNNQVR